MHLRPATIDDCPLILQLIRELADYERLLHEVEATAHLLETHLFGAQPRAEALIVEADGEVAGFALFFHNFSTFLGKPGLYLEDLYIRPAFRGRGYGRQVMQALARIALAGGCGRFEWWVLDWNSPAIEFYRSLGAQSMSDWTVQRVSGEALAALASGATG
ncbi:MAG: GNAT family N-acetyltransferase [Rhodanobacteraceae bacterium]|nr:GNAT family N-acetyltransferase [Rhodanobacteraceae bacterium]